jgi:hypothetical protein
MRSPTPSALATPRHTPRVWDEVRLAFSSSILVDTPINSLAQNLEGMDWPLRGDGETPADYIDLSYDEMREQLAIRGQPPRIADHLIDILRETLAFDNPFAEMITQSSAGAADENPLLKNMEKLRIPTDFPITLTCLAADALFFCELEKITTLGEFALAAQRMAGSVIVGGDFRALLNALSHIDERTIAQYLPFRPGAKGLHYIEGLALAVRAQPVAIQAALAHELKQALPDDVAKRARTVDRQQLLQARIALHAHANALRGFCQEDYADLKRQIDAGDSPRRLVAELGDPLVEAVVADLISPALAAPAAPVGWLARLKNWWTL